MLPGLALLAQIAAATPAPTPAVRLGSASTSVSAKPKTLAELARERKLGRKGVAGTFSIAGASGMPEMPADGAGNEGGSSAQDGRARVKSAQADVQAARRAVDDAATRSGMTSEEAAAARRKLIEAQRELGKAREDAARPGR